MKSPLCDDSIVRSSPFCSKVFGVMPTMYPFEDQDSWMKIDDLANKRDYSAICKVELSSNMESQLKLL